MGIGNLTIDCEEYCYVDFNDTHGGLTIFIHQSYESLGADLKYKDVLELKKYIDMYLKHYNEDIDE